MHILNQKWLKSFNFRIFRNQTGFYMFFELPPAYILPKQQTFFVFRRKNEKKSNFKKKKMKVWILQNQMHTENQMRAAALRHRIFFFSLISHKYQILTGLGWNNHAFSTCKHKDLINWNFGNELKFCLGPIFTFFFFFFVMKVARITEILDKQKIFKGIFSDSNNIFLWHKSEDINKKRLFPKFQLILILHS